MGMGFADTEELAAVLDADTEAVAFVGFREHAIASGDNKSKRRESIGNGAYTRRQDKAGAGAHFSDRLPDEMATR